MISRLKLEGESRRLRRMLKDATLCVGMPVPFALCLAVDAALKQLVFTSKRAIPF